MLYSIIDSTYSAVSYIYRDERRLVEPPTVAFDYNSGISTNIESKRPTPGYGLTWSLNKEDPQVRDNIEFGIRREDILRGTVTISTFMSHT